MITNKLTYKGYTSEIKFSAEDKVLYGKLEGITDLVNFEHRDARKIEKEFHKAVDDYLLFLKMIKGERK